MKKHITLSTLLLFCTFVLFSQVPQAVCYQAAAKDATGADLVSQEINIRATVLKNSVNGVPEWQETHLVTTDQFGLFTINIGQGIYAAGNQTEFKNIEWGTGTFWLRIEMDTEGGQNFVMMGTSQLLSVPYALYADGSNRAVQAELALYADSTAAAAHADFADQAQNAQSAVFAEQAATAQTAGAADSASFSLVADMAMTLAGNNDYDPTNEIQQLVYANDTLKLTNGNGVATGGSIYLPENTDPDPENELQTLSMENGVLTISGVDPADGGEVTIEDSDTFNAPGSSSDFPQGIIGEHIVLTTGQYQVPDSTTFWITAGGPIIKLLNIGPPPVLDHPTTPNMPVLGEESVIEDCMCTGILIRNTDIVIPVVLDYITDINTYTVPDGKVLFIKSGLKNDQIGQLRVNGADMEFLRPSFTRGTRIISFPEDTTIQAIPNAFGEIDIVLTGYLLDKDSLTFDPNGN